MIEKSKAFLLGTLDAILLTLYMMLVYLGKVLKAWTVLLFVDGVSAIVITLAWNLFAGRHGLWHLAFVDVWAMVFLVDFSRKSVK